MMNFPYCLHKSPLGLLIIFALGCSPQPDQLMIENFQKNRSLFDSVVTMVHHDLADSHKVGYIPPDEYSGRETNLSPSRVEEYLAILDRIGIDRLSVYQDELSVTFFTRHMSLDAFKTFQYDEEPPDTLFSSLDDIPVDFPPYGTAYRRLDDKWYIVYYSSSE